MSPSLDSPARQTRSVDSVKVAEKDMRISFRVSHFPHISHLVSHASHIYGWPCVFSVVGFPFPTPSIRFPFVVRFLFRVVHSLHCMQRSCCPVWALHI